MLTAHATARIVLDYADRDKRHSRISFRVPFSLDESSAAAVRNHIIGLIAPLTDAMLVGTKTLWEYSDSAAVLPTADIIIQSKAALFYRNPSRFEAFYIPAPTASLFEADGDYAGIRVDVTDEDKRDAMLALALALSATVTIEGLPFPDVFIAGGKVI